MRLWREAPDMAVEASSSLTRQCSPPRPLAENAIRNIRGVIRTLKVAVENNISEKLADDSIMMAWIVQHAAKNALACNRSPLVIR